MDVLIYSKLTESRFLIKKSITQLSESINIVSVDNISQAFFTLGAYSFDLIIIDVGQFEGGFNKLIIRAKNLSPDASILFLTLVNNNGVEVNLLRDGIDYSFGRYFLFEEFIDTIKKVANQFLEDSYQYSTI
ncbi:MAG: hypothetical protein NTX65_10825 [Ignavibacteriales bacterium]|nr:hypothetical protein [Ignavibacteriales bacterium]